MTLTLETGEGRTLGYSVDGSGPTLVMIPGGPGIDPTAFYADAVLPGFQRIVLLPGAGHLVHVDAPEAWAAAVDPFLRSR